MIETGTPDEIKESILGNMTWQPDLDTLKRVKVCFEAQELKTLVVNVKTYQLNQKKAQFQTWPVVVVSFSTKRDISGAMAKLLRAVKAARLSLFQFNVTGVSSEGHRTYSAELRERE